MRYDDAKFLWRCDFCTYNGFNDTVVAAHEEDKHKGQTKPVPLISCPACGEIVEDLTPGTACPECGHVEPEEEDEEIDPEVAAEFAAAQEALQAMLLTEDDFNDAGKQALELLKLMEK